MSKDYLFSSESVFRGHPDKVADQISDAVLDSHLAIDPEARVACNTLVAKNLVVLAGEITSNANVCYEAVARKTLREIGYTDESCGLNGLNCEFFTSISHQSVNIGRGVSRIDGQVGAGDQGLMFGYATDETPELMPLGISLAHRISQKQYELRRSGVTPWMNPDGKTQVTVRYVDSRPVAVDKVVFSTHHAPDVSNAEIRDTVVSQIIEEVIPARLRSRETEYLVNPAGRFEVGGPQADTGLTGRKIIADSYGGYCAHGGGAFSGKDPTKVDRSAAYMARYIAKNIVAAKLASRCTVQLAYAIGQPDPVSVMLDVHGTSNVDDSKLSAAVMAIFKPTPSNIIGMLNLRRPIYAKTAVFGHFGRELPEFTWERTDRIAALNDFFGLASGSGLGRETVSELA